MLGLRRWHINLLVSELLAAAVVISGYREAVRPRPWWNFVDFSKEILSPGVWLLGRSPINEYTAMDQYASICLAAALVYTAAFFILLTGFSVVAGRAGRRLRIWSQSNRREQADLARYLR